MRLLPLLGLLTVALISINFVFGVVYWMVGGLEGVRAGHFGDDVFFSIQTFSTTGYGAIHPRSLAANVVSSVEILFGVLSTALATGLIFARLSRPQARVVFSRNLVVDTWQGVPTLMFRVANQRRNQITDAHISVTMTRDETDAAGRTMRRLIDLTLERDRSPAFALSWTVMHRIDERSPLHGLDLATMQRDNVLFLCVLTGLDDTLLATIVTRHVYGAADVRIGARFADIFDRAADGSFAIDYTRFHDLAE